MSFYKIINGAIPTGDEWMANVLESLSLGGLNLIRMLQDRSVDFSADGSDWFAEAYVDADGRENSVDTSSTTATFDTDKYTTILTDEASSDTTHDPNSFTNPENAFDSNDSTYASKNAGSGTTATFYIGKTFSSKKIGALRWKTHQQWDNNQSGSFEIRVETYDGSSWNDLKQIAYYSDSTIDSFDSNGVTSINTTCQGIRLKLINTAGSSRNNQIAYIYSLEYGEVTEAKVYHTIPSGSLSSTVSSSYAKVMYDDYESGVSVQYKLTNSSEDSGWLDENKLSTFTTFTSEPTTLIVKLNPKSTSPTAGYPSIKGVAVRGS